MDRWLCHRKLTHLSHPDLALLPLAHDAKVSKEAINLGGTHRNGMQSIVKAHDQILGVQESLKETIKAELSSDSHWWSLSSGFQFFCTSKDETMEKCGVNLPGIYKCSHIIYLCDADGCGKSHKFVDGV